MRQKRENPPGLRPAGFLNSSLPGGSDDREIAQTQAVCQAVHGDNSRAATTARIELLIDDIGDNAGAMTCYLNCVLAHRDAGDIVGMIYSIRMARAYWRAIAASANDLIAAQAARLSAIRQAEGGAP
jgi:hypothetical protein